MLAAVVAAAGVAAGLVVSEWPGGAPALPRARVYENVDACLLTGPGGVQDRAAAQVWAGMEDASAATSARVSYLAVTGPATEADAESFLGALLVQGCRVVVASGVPEQAAVLAQARRFGQVRFVVTGAVTGQPNVTGIAFAPSGLRSAVAVAVAVAVESGVRSA